MTLSTLEFKNIRLTEVGTLQTVKGNLVIKDPSFQRFDIDSDLASVPFGSWKIHLIETNIRKGYVMSVGCLLQHESSKIDVFPSILTKKWKTVQKGTLQSGILAIVNEENFNTNVPIEIKKKYDNPLVKVNTWYDWCRQEINERKAVFIKGGCLISNFELQRKFNVTRPKIG